MMLYYEKLESLQPIISSECCLCKNTILYKYQVTLIVFDSFLLSNNLWQDTKKF